MVRGTEEKAFRGTLVTGSDSLNALVERVSELKGSHEEIRSNLAKIIEGTQKESAKLSKVKEMVAVIAIELQSTREDVAEIKTTITTGGNGPLLTKVGVLEDRVIRHERFLWACLAGLATLLTGMGVLVLRTFKLYLG